MKIKIKRFNKNLPLPKKQTKKAAAFDLMAKEKVKILPKSVGYVSLNVAIETPEGCFLLLAARSSTHKKGLMLVNGIGIIDPDYCGDKDECVAAYFNFTDVPVVVEEGDRIAQGLFTKSEVFDWHEVDAMDNVDRGGFGSTGE